MSQHPNPEADRASTLSTFVAFMTLFGSAQQVLKTRMQHQAEQGLGPLHLRALCLCLHNPGGTQQQVAQLLNELRARIGVVAEDE